MFGQQEQTRHRSCSIPHSNVVCVSQVCIAVAFIDQVQSHLFVFVLDGHVQCGLVIAWITKFSTTDIMFQDL